MTETAYPEFTAAQKIAKALAWDLGVDASLTSMGLNFWPVNSIIKIITDKIWSQIRLGADLAAINFVNQAHYEAFTRSYAALSVIAHDKGIESPQFIEARKNAQKALAAFVRYGAA